MRGGINYRHCVDMNKKQKKRGATSSSTVTTLSRCPNCKCEDMRMVVGQRAVCHPCSSVLRRVYQFCWVCQREWPSSGGDSCTLPGCATRAALLSPELIGKLDLSQKQCNGTGHWS
ncbi:E3 ubiquitin-protein ligase RNF144A-like [Arapaima gigas]